MFLCNSGISKSIPFEAALIIDFLTKRSDPTKIKLDIILVGFFIDENEVIPINKKGFNNGQAKRRKNN